MGHVGRASLFSGLRCQDRASTCALWIVLGACLSRLRHASQDLSESKFFVVLILTNPGPLLSFAGYLTFSGKCLESGLIGVRIPKFGNYRHQSRVEGLRGSQGCPMLVRIGSP